MKISLKWPTWNNVVKGFKGSPKKKKKKKKKDSKEYTTIFGALKFPTFVSWYAPTTMKMYIMLINCLLTKNLKKKCEILDKDQIWI
jgi:hypothetical protein